MSTDTNASFPIPAERVHEMVSKWHELETALKALSDNCYCARLAVDALQAAIQLVIEPPTPREDLSEDGNEGEEVGGRGRCHKHGGR
jgi:hypothetical protein